MVTMISNSRHLAIFLAAVLATNCIATTGCNDRDTGLSFLPVRLLPARSFHQKFGWQADKFFDDKQVIELCHAIEANDLDAMERLIQAGAKVNARGQGNMTPLMWAFPDNKLERFTKLLDHGADPNVQFTSNLNVPSAFKPGDSVTSLSAGTRFPGYFAAVMKAGGDPNIKDGSGMSALHVIVLAMLPDAIPRSKIAIERGADLNALENGMTPAVAAVATAGQYDLALFFLEKGTDPNIYLHDELQRIIHCVVRDEKHLPTLPATDKEAHRRLLNWLVEHGENVDEVREDLKRWKKFPVWNPRQTARMRQEEVAKRKAREREARGESQAAVGDSETK